MAGSVCAHLDFSADVVSIEDIEIVAYESAAIESNKFVAGGLELGRQNSAHLS